MLVAKCVRVGAAVLGLFLVGDAAAAADLNYYGGYKDQPPSFALPSALWQGFYGGGHVGGLWSNIDAAENIVILSPAVAVQGHESISGRALFAGLQGGYNFQAGNFLYGLEADLGGMDVSGSRTFSIAAPLNSVTVSASGGLYGDITARAGFSYGSALLYAKGGFAFFTGDVKVADGGANISQNSGTFAGWTLGGGVEFMITPRWTVKGEYLYYDFGNNNFSSILGPASARFDDTLTMHTVKVGVNFLMQSSVAPLY